MLKRLLSSWLAALTLLSVPADASAQQPLQIPKDQISSAGTIKGVRNGVFHVANVGGDQWLLAVAEDAEEVVLRGTATADWLRPGMAVQFQGNFFKNKSGQPQGEARQPVGELKVFTPREDSKMGIKEQSKRGSFLSSGSASDSALETAPFSVSGVLTKYRGNRITVVVGKTQIRAKLADDVEIQVDLTDPRLASAGDEIEFEGWHYVGQENQVYATNVWITLAHPLGEAGAGQAAKKPNASVKDVTDEQRAAAQKIQTALARAKKWYESGDLTRAVAIVESVIEQWDSLTQSDEPVVRRLLDSHHKQLKLVHAFLEMEGCMLPPLPEASESETGSDGETRAAR